MVVNFLFHLIFFWQGAMVSFAANETENIGSFSEAASAQLNDFVVNDANGIIDLLAVKV